MSIAIFVAAGLLAAPQVTPEQARRLQRDYPTAAIRDRKSAASVIRVGIDPAGKVIRCATLAVIGDAELGKAACNAYLRGNLKFSPAVDADGSPAYGVVTTIIKYFLPETRQGREVEDVQQALDVSLTIATLPANSVLEFSVYAQVKSDGRVGACEGNATAPLEYADLACETLADSEQGVLLGTDGQAVPFVTALKVRVSAGNTPE